MEADERLDYELRCFAILRTELHGMQEFYRERGGEVLSMSFVGFPPQSVIEVNLLVRGTERQFRFHVSEDFDRGYSVDGIASVYGSNVEEEVIAPDK
jgi:hypothetical protein